MDIATYVTQPIVCAIRLGNVDSVCIVGVWDWLSSAQGLVMWWSRVRGACLALINGRRMRLCVKSKLDQHMSEWFLVERPAYVSRQPQRIATALQRACMYVLESEANVFWGLVKTCVDVFGRELSTSFSKHFCCANARFTIDASMGARSSLLVTGRPRTSDARIIADPSMPNSVYARSFHQRADPRVASNSYPHAADLDWPSSVYNNQSTIQRMITCCAGCGEW